MSNATNGAGTSTGLFTTALSTNSSGITPPGTTTAYECNFSGAAGRISVMMWRNGINNCQQLFAIERALNVSGVYQNTYVTLATLGLVAGSNNASGRQQSLYFGVGASPLLAPGNAFGALNVRGCGGGGSATGGSFNGSLPVDFVAPYVEFHHFPMTSVGSMAGADVNEGVTFTLTLYGSTRTDIPSKAGPFIGAGPATINGGYAVAMRYE